MFYSSNVPSRPMNRPPKQEVLPPTPPEQNARQQLSKLGQQIAPEQVAAVNERAKVIVDAMRREKALDDQVVLNPNYPKGISDPYAPDNTMAA